jgi:hypothetical protein
MQEEKLGDPDRLSFGIPSPSAPCGNADGQRGLKLATQIEIVS